MASAVGIGRFIYTPILPPMAEGLALSTGEAGLIASANFLGYLAGALVAALPSLRIGTRRLLLAGLAVSAVTTAAMGWADGLGAFLGLRFAGGVASAIALVFASALVLERLAATGRSELAAIHFAGVGAGIALSAVLIWLVDSAGGGWRAMWLGGGALSLFALLAVVCLVPGERSGGAAPGGEAGAAPARLWPLVTAYGLFGFGYVITATFIVAIVRQSPQSAAMEPLVWLVVGLTAIPSVALWSWLGRRYGTIRMFALACVVEAVGIVLAVLWADAAGSLLAAIFLGGTFMAITALGLIIARELSPADPRRALALMTAAFGFGQILGPLVAGYGFDLTGSFLIPSFLAAAGLCLGGVLTARMASG